MECHNVPEVAERQVPREACWDEPEKSCHEIPREACEDVGLKHARISLVRPAKMFPEMNAEQSPDRLARMSSERNEIMFPVKEHQIHHDGLPTLPHHELPYPRWEFNFGK